jgi:gluconate 2-dehydrogenase subunit 3-like protein
MDRRTTIKWVLTASAAWPLIDSAPAATPAAKGYGTDPTLTRNYTPGELWPLTFTAAQRRLAGILADIIIPSDDHSPSASAVGVVEFIDEWVSAPYPLNIRDRGIALGGFTWLDAEALRRFGKGFSELDTAGQHGICDDICDESRATVPRRAAARFFSRYRDLTAGGFYSTPAGRKDLNYIGNVPFAGNDGPPAALLKALNLP